MTNGNDEPRMGAPTLVPWWEGGALSSSYDVARLRREATEMLEALRDLREASEDAYKAGRISAEPFVRAGNVLFKVGLR